MRDGIDLKSVIYHNSPNVSEWPATVELQGVEFKPGPPSDGNCGVRPIFSRAAANVRWPDVRVWTHNPETGKPNAPTDGWIQFTLWAFVKVLGVWHGAALHEFWSDRHGAARVWTGAPILTQWSDWVYRNQWGAEMQSYRPAAGDDIGFMLTAGDRRSPHNVGEVLERTNVIRVMLQPTAMAMPIEDEAAQPVPPAPTPAPVPPSSPAPMPPSVADQFQSLQTAVVQALAGFAMILDAHTRQAQQAVAAYNALAAKVDALAQPVIVSQPPAVYDIRVGGERGSRVAVAVPQPPK